MNTLIIPQTLNIIESVASTEGYTVVSNSLRTSIQVLVPRGKIGIFLREVFASITGQFAPDDHAAAVWFVSSYKTSVNFADECPEFLDMEWHNFLTNCL